MNETISLMGLVATTPRHLVTQSGLPITSFRVACPQTKWNPETQTWDANAGDNWYTVTSFHKLAMNVFASISKGDRIMVTGHVRVRDWDNGDRAGVSVEVEAISIGHDLAWGTSEFTRTELVRDALVP